MKITLGEPKKNFIKQNVKQRDSRLPQDVEVLEPSMRSQLEQQEIPPCGPATKKNNHKTSKLIYTEVTKSILQTQKKHN